MTHLPSNDKLLEIIDRAKTTPYVHNGRHLGTGFDCLGFIIYFYNELGFSLPSDDGHSIAPTWFLDNPRRFVNGLKSLGFPVIKKDNLQSLDLALFSVFNSAITHSGILITPTKFVHMTPNNGLIISKLEHYWYRHCHGGFRIIST